MDLSALPFVALGVVGLAAAFAPALLAARALNLPRIADQ